MSKKCSPVIFCPSLYYRCSLLINFSKGKIIFFSLLDVIVNKYPAQALAFSYFKASLQFMCP